MFPSQSTRMMSMPAWFSTFVTRLSGSIMNSRKSLGEISGPVFMAMSSQMAA